MNKRALIMAAAAAFPGLALAQSTVTVYGLFDMSVNYLKLSRTATKAEQHLTTVSNDSSRLGFRGTEDLGSGQRAYFKLEHGLSPDTGAQTNATTFWSREAYVGVGDARLGSVQLGSQYTPAVWTTGKIDPFNRFGNGAIVGVLQGAPRAWTVTMNNAVQYVSPDLGGVTVRAMGAPGEGAVTGRSMAGSVEYASGKFYGAVNYERNGQTAASVGLPGSGSVQSTNWMAGATYDFTVVKIAGWYQTNRVDNVPKVSGQMFGLTIPTGTGQVLGSYDRRTQTNANAKQLAAAYYHFLSKRTWLYAQVARVSNSGTAAFGLGPSRTEQAAAGALSAGRDVTGVQLGIRHFF